MLIRGIKVKVSKYYNMRRKLLKGEVVHMGMLEVNMNPNADNRMYIEICEKKIYLSLNYQLKKDFEFVVNTDDEELDGDNFCFSETFH